MTCVVGNTSMVVTLVRLTCSLQIHRYVHGVVFHFAMDAPSWTVGFFLRYTKRLLLTLVSLSVTVWRVSPIFIQNPTSQKSPKF
jgi:hypothetical protein